MAEESMAAGGMIKQNLRGVKVSHTPEGIIYAYYICTAYYY